MSSGEADFKTYLESLLELRIYEDGGQAITDGELVNLLLEFLGAGTKSTNKLCAAEVDVIVGADRGTIEEAEISRMLYLKAVVLESLLLYPPMPFVVHNIEAGEEATNMLDCWAPRCALL
ncbi:hypothetical protein ABZP36_002792 [Zizania latifolia]